MRGKHKTNCFFIEYFVHFVCTLKSDWNRSREKCSYSNGNQHLCFYKDGHNIQFNALFIDEMQPLLKLGRQSVSLISLNVSPVMSLIPTLGGMF